MSSSALSSSDDDLSDEEALLVTPQKRKYFRSIFQKHNRNLKRKIHVDLKPDAGGLEESDPRADTDASGQGPLLSSDDELNEASNLHDSSDMVIFEDSDMESDIALSLSEDSDEALTDPDTDGNTYEFTNENNLHKSEPLYDGASHSVFTSYVSIMLFVMKHSLTRDAFSDLLYLIDTHLPKGSKFTSSVYRLKQVLKTLIGFEEPVKRFFCEICGVALPGGGEHCQKPSCMRATSKALVFHDLRLEKQLAELFKDESFCKLVLDKPSQTENSKNTMSDISDGSEYRRMTNLPKISPKERNLTFTMNTDGVTLFSSSHKGNLWPVYLAINELPVKMRFSKKYLITSHVYCQSEKPTMLTYLAPLMNSLEKLHTEGMKVLTPRGEALIRFHLLAVSLDLPARAMVLNMKQFNGKFGCCYCEDEGTNPPNQPTLRYYPYENNSTPRQHNSMVTDARCATDKREPVKGIKGASPLIKLKYIDLPKTFVIDWMHSVLLGVVKTILAMWFDSAYKGRNFYIGDKMALINSRLLGIQLPDYITRQQRNIEDYKHWKASECRAWLLHYCIPVISGIQDPDITLHFALVVTALYLLNQDSISTSDVEAADSFLQKFCQLFPTIYDTRKQTMNIHLLRHLPEFVKLHGPIFNYSCFGFESMNNHLKNMVHGTRYINDQICFAVGITKCLPDLVKSLAEGADHRVKLLFHHINKTLASDDIGDRDERVLGALKEHQLNDKERELVGAAVEETSVKKCFRVQNGVGVLFSEEYKRTKQRNSFSVMYKEGDTKKFGTIKYYLKIDNNLFAIVNKFQMSQNTLLNLDAVRNPDLVKFKSRNLCPQYSQLSEQQREELELVPVQNITAKCVFMACQKNKKIVSCPPNMLEHS